MIFVGDAIGAVAFIMCVATHNTYNIQMYINSHNYYNTHAVAS